MARLLFAATLALSFAPSLAYPSASLSWSQPPVDFTQWMAPGANDVRGPCPGLNSLANHGILPRNGRGITLPILASGLKRGLNVGADVAAGAGGFGLSTSSNADASFDLDNLIKHGAIEHDASLSREDTALGDARTFNQTIWNTVLNELHGSNVFTPAIASAARVKRVEQEFLAHPLTFTWTPKEAVISASETALYLSTMGDPVSGVARVDYVCVLFEQERLPYNEGWRPSSTETTFPTLTSLSLRLIANEPPLSLLKSGFILGASTVLSVLSGRAATGLAPCLIIGRGCVQSQ